MKNKVKKELKKYDENGNLIYSKNLSGYERWYEYDENNKLTSKHIKLDKRFEVWKYYDENGRLIHTKHLNGYETWREYDENGNCIHYKNSEGKERRYKYE